MTSYTVRPERSGVGRGGLGGGELAVYLSVQIDQAARLVTFDMHLGAYFGGAMKQLIVMSAILMVADASVAQDGEQDRTLLDETTASLTGGSDSFARDVEEIRALVEEYIALFNARKNGELAERVFTAPAQAATFTLSTTEDIERFFDQVHAGIEPEYDRSVINNIAVCLAGSDVAFVDLHYSRLDGNGAPIEPVERASLLVVREVEDMWRISALYPHDGARQVSC